MELDELPDHAVRPEHLGDTEHEVRRRCPLGQLTRQFEANHLRQQHVDGLTDHDRFGLDAADAPADDAKSVDHRGVTVGSDQ